MPRITSSNLSPSSSPKLEPTEQKGFSYWMRSVSSKISIPSFSKLCLKIIGSLQKVMDRSVQRVKAFKGWVFTKFSSQKKEEPSNPPTDLLNFEEMKRVREEIIEKSLVESPLEIPVPIFPKTLVFSGTHSPSDETSSPFVVTPLQAEQTALNKQPTPIFPTIPSDSELISPSPTRLLTHTPKFRNIKNGLPRTPSLQEALLNGAKKRRKECRLDLEDNKTPETPKTIELELEQESTTEIKKEKIQDDITNFPRLPLPFLLDIKNNHISLKPSTPHIKESTGLRFNPKINQQYTPPSLSDSSPTNWSE